MKVGNCYCPCPMCLKKVIWPFLKKYVEAKIERNALRLNDTARALMNKLFKWANPGLFLFIFSLFKQTIHFYDKST